ncbi:hypothetical protein KCH_59310 [Kitasatospora cheerisanensis KCTC 2395]|uniref:Uncharacterized protein n=1 Tax=Kitasatospora cheerisanensis KCTC 2395 TaxID=1348663 RepID=A0A066YR07_9ACTN|nr:hypothetical protein KCH_59310 [Kitasatospora cheerisanensis KCTC 2395]
MLGGGHGGLLVVKDRTGEVLTLARTPARPLPSSDFSRPGR